MDFHYDFQTRRYLLQFMRIFSDIKVRNGPDANGLFSITRVPITYGDPSSLVAQVIKGNSENTMLPAPMFSVWIEGIKVAPERRRDTQYIGKVSTMEREFSELSGEYGAGPGIRYDIDRYMPVPYDMTLKLDCWTTNTTNKFQLMEQIACIFNPSLQLQQNSSLIDWTSLFEVWLEEFTWTNRSIPQGGEMDRDVMSWRFRVPIWINPPAKIKRSTLVAEIVSNVFNVGDIDGVAATIDAGDYDVFRSCFSGTPSQIITTEGNYKIEVVRNGVQDEIILLNKFGEALPIISWQGLVKAYGQIAPNITKIRLKLDPNLDSDDADIIGGIVQDPTRQNVLIFTPDLDTLPSNTMMPVLSIIDPTEVTPGNGLPIAIAGQRYLLTSASSVGEEPAIPPGVATSPWGANIVAYPNDVIEYNGITWRVAFDSRVPRNTKQYVVNNSNGSHYMFDGKYWAYTYYGVYAGGYWRIDNIAPETSE